MNTTGKEGYEPIVQGLRVGPNDGEEPLDGLRACCYINRNPILILACLPWQTRKMFLKIKYSSLDVS